ncbi:MAG TPA: SDR family oxidoreductase [Rhodanobacteraceae bacterium]|jgi:NAD(P)-dependent dehydrogenase (short-subunit alcohol dehydrogenase family)|nr:SDR family oxidoreductase [Rhodanobacteraceae bacterium]
MSSSLNGQRAMVTGSTAGIGYAIAAELARAGAEVIINGRTQQRVDQALHALRTALGPDAKLHGVAADVGSAAGTKVLIERHPDVDILINNAGIFAVQPFLESSDEDWQKFYEVNVLSGVRLSRHYLAGMLERNRGRIVFISSESGIQIPVEMIHYGMTKAAQIAIARGLAQLTAGTAVTVNSVLPGPTRSEGVGTFVAEFARKQGVTAKEFERGFFETARPTSLLKRFIEPEEIARVVAFVASPDASAISGAAVRAEGGVVLSAF